MKSSEASRAPRARGAGGGGPGGFADGEGGAGRPPWWSTTTNAAAVGGRRWALALATMIFCWGRVGAAATFDTTVVTNTLTVEDMTVHAGSLWTATRGGVERYFLSDLVRDRVYTTADGLETNHVWRVDVVDGTLHARTLAHDCTLEEERFACTPAPPLSPEPVVAPRFEGARVTERLDHGGRSFVATAGAGVWLDVPGGTARRLSPANQICSNHITAAEEFAGRTWLGSFDEGLCWTTDGSTFHAVEGAFRMINDLQATPERLYVAASEGLYETADGERFERETFVTQLGVNGLAFNGKSLYATTPGALWRIRINGGLKTKAWWAPGGSHSLQGVAAGKKVVWLASEDVGAIRMTLKGFEVFDRAAGLPSSWVVDIGVGPGDVAYAGTLRHGVVAIDRRGRIRSVSGLPDDWILDVRTVDGRVWVGTQGGAARIERSGAVTMLPALPHGSVHLFHSDGVRTYIGTEGGTTILSEV